MLDFFAYNKEWLFSGAGVTVIVFVSTIFFKKRTKQEKREDLFGLEYNTKKQPLVSIYSFIPKLILNHRFKDTRLDSLISLDVRPRGESVQLDLGELPKCQVWLKLTNHSPFDLDIESIKGDLNYYGCTISLETNQHIDIYKHSSNENILLEGPLTGEQAEHCSRYNEGTLPSLTIRSRVKTRLGVFKKQSRGLQAVNVQLLNIRSSNIDV